MAFAKKANAMVTHPRVSQRNWNGLRRVASSGVSDFSDQARKILGGPLDPDQYLFTHCTIVASVDTESVPNARLGKFKTASGGLVDRRYPDYHITPQSAMFVNNNGDSWSRPVLLSSYRTFIGSHNFLEHVQIEEKSKGRIIDAVARDIGDSVYVDILVATNRRHASLIADIESGKMGTLSMGCTTDFTICSKCGHYAVDETELCEHVRYAKLNTFMDDHGQKRVIAELCGHEDYDETGGVNFIEASWVAVPAFPGAVMRNVLTAGEVQEKTSEMQRIFASPAPSWSDSAIAKAASAATMSAIADSSDRLTRKAFNFGDEDEGGEKEPAEPKKPFQDLEDEVVEFVKGNVKRRLKEEIKQKNTEKAVKNPPAADWTNDSVIKEARQEGFLAARKAFYNRTLATLVRTASSDIALVEGLAEIDTSFVGHKIDPTPYRAALQAGPISRYADTKEFVRACQKAAGRQLVPAELRVVVRVGTLLSQRERLNPTTP